MITDGLNHAPPEIIVTVPFYVIPRAMLLCLASDKRMSRKFV